MRVSMAKAERRSRAASGDPQPRQSPGGTQGGIRSILNPIWCYHGFRSSVLVLTFFGLVMVFSSSSVALVAAGVSPWSQALSQGVYCLLGLVIGVAASFVPSSTLQRLSVWGMLIALVLQALTLTSLRVEVNGNSGWIGREGVFTMQPAEVTKLALCLWLPAALKNAQQRAKKEGMRAYLVPIAVFVASLLLVLAGKDVGTALIIVLIGIIAFLVGGFPILWMAGVFLVVIVGLASLVITSPNRMERIFATYQSCSKQDAAEVCYQAIHARYAIASGGFLGVGLGNSREKWNYLPEAHNDFIYAIIGEETGFIGAGMVVVLFAVLAWCMICIALQHSNRYAAMVLVCIAVWITGQAIINIMVVIGLLPVIGVPMPFVSAGGSSLVMCLAAAGVAVSMMRSQSQIHAGSSALNS